MAEQSGGFTETYNAFMQEDEPTMELDLRDEIDKVLAEMVVLNRRKRRDYGIDGDPLSNFFRTAEIMRGKGYKGWDALTSVHYAIAIKEARLEALRLNGRLDATANESVRDTLIDAAVYAVLCVAVYDRLYATPKE